MRNEQGVIISLIVFIVLTLVFGVTTYFGVKGYQEQKAALATAQSELASALAENETLGSDLANFKAKLGYGEGSAAEIINGKDGSEKRGSEDESKAVHYNGMADDVLEALGADDTFKGAVAKLSAKIADANGKIAALVKDRDDQVDAALAQVDASVKQTTTYDANVAKSTQDQETALAAEREAYASLTEQFNAQTKEFDAQKRNAREAVETARAETEKERAAADNFAEINLDLSRRIDLLTENDFEEADAFIVSTDQVARIVRLSVGTADGIRPLTKFNVFPKEALEHSGVKAKASVQVTRSLEEHVCEARILEDDQNNPVQPGDIVFTPLWRPGDVYKYALDYRLDINGDGFSDIGEIYNMIEISGGEVAAYIDDQGVVHGKITPDVFRVVTADEPILDRVNLAENLSDEQRAKIQEDQANFLASAKENGVRAMRLPDLLVQIGYKKTRKLNRYHDEMVAGEAQAAASQAQVGSNATAPIINSKDGGDVPGSVLPVFEEGADKQAGKTTSFRKRAPKN